MPLTGLLPAVLTPFDVAGELNLDAVERQAALLAADGITAVFVGGTTGESSSLTVAERFALTQRWVDVTRGTPMKVVVHVGASCLADARAIAAQANELGVAAIAAVSPSYFKPKSIAELVECCVHIATAAPNTPFYFYDIPSMTGVSLPMADFLERAADRIPTLAGLKFSNPDLTTFQRLLRVRGGRYEVLWGTDEYLLAALALGGSGAVGSTYNFATPLFHKVIAAFNAGDLAAAREHQYRAVRLITLLFQYGHLAACKEAMRVRGIDLGGVRLPLTNLTRDAATTLRRELESLDWR